MITKLKSVAYRGIEVIPVEVQVQIAPGVPIFNIVGLPDKAVAESKERVRAAIHALGISLPPKRITINLAPADIAKEGSHFDLPIACGILACLGVFPHDQVENFLFLGELALDGGINYVAGVLPAAMAASGLDLGIVCPAASGSEARWAGELNIIAASHLLDLLKYFKGESLITAPELGIIRQDNYEDIDLKDVRGQELAKRALIITAAGGHNLLMLGTPGSGKSMLASRINSILPPLDQKEILELSMIYSVAGLLKKGELSSKRPYRAPHHSCSMAAMIGGGMNRQIKPGEVSLSHHGVLFLDELPEFARQVLDALRQPVETGEVLIARSGQHVTYPAKFQLVAAMNPCHCGYLTEVDKACNKAPRCGENYMNKISGPLYDRFDLKIEVSPLSLEELTKSEAKPGIDSKTARELVINARNYRKERLKNTLEGYREEDTLSEAAKKMLQAALEKYRFSMRRYQRLVRVARTAADLAVESEIGEIHMAEALALQTRLLM